MPSVKSSARTCHVIHQPLMRHVIRFLQKAGLLLLLFAAFVFSRTDRSFAQDITVNFKADSNHIVIGDFLNVHLAIKSDKKLSVVMPPLADTVGNMELVKASKIDTQETGDSRTLLQTYTVSAYDSGNYHAGPQRIILKHPGGKTDTIFSEQLAIAVTTVPVDTSKAFKAINAPLAIPYSLTEFIPLIGGGIVLIALIAALIWYLRRRGKRKPLVIERPKPRDPAHVWAKKELKKLEEEKLWQKDEIKLYYSQLTYILRMYLEYRYNWLALESTTEKISEEIAAYDIPLQARKKLLMILDEADLAKFAKRVPGPDANMQMMDEAYYFIDLTEPKTIEKKENVSA